MTCSSRTRVRPEHPQASCGILHACRGGEGAWPGASATNTQIERGSRAIANRMLRIIAFDALHMERVSNNVIQHVSNERSGTPS